MPLSANSIQLGPWVGVRYDLPVEDVAWNEISSMSNVRIGLAGELSQRKGTKSYNSLAAVNSAATVTMCAQFKSDATTEHVIIVAGNKIYDYSSGVWTDRTAALTVTAGDDNTFEWADANGVLVATNGVDTNAWKIAGAANATVLDDNARFSVGKHIAWFDNRLWIGNVNGATNQVWHSNTADIETWEATSFFNFGGIVTGLVPTQNALVVHTTDGIYTLIATGNAALPYLPNKQTNRGGLDGRSCVALPDDTQVVVLEDGVYLWSGGGQLTKISQDLDSGYWTSLNTSRLSHTFATYFPRENEVWFALPRGGTQTKMNNFMVWNRLRNKWHGPHEGWERNCMALIDDVPHAGDFGGLLFDHDSAIHSDAGAAINSRAETGAPSPEGADVRVRWLTARHYYDAQGLLESINIIQRGAGLNTELQELVLLGDGFTLDADFLDLTTLAELVQVSQDINMQGYGPQTSLEMQKNTAGETWTHRKIFARYKSVGRHIKKRPKD